MPDDPQAVFAIERPIPRLLAVYAVRALLMGPLFPVAIFPLFFRYRTMRYRFDDTGIVMSWGVLFHRETTIAYARIQDIHLTSNVVERWLGLARIQIQTASGSARAEMVLEGLPDSGRIRDFLYARMRGVRTASATVALSTATGEAAGADSAAVAAALHETAQELRSVRELLAARLGTGGGDGR